MLPRLGEQKMTAEKFKAIRKQLGLTQRDLASNIEMSREMISLMEMGKEPIRKRTEFSMLYLLMVSNRFRGSAYR